MQNGQIAYDYIKKAYDTALQLRAQAADRYHKLLLTTVFLFAGLSYGVTQLTFLSALPLARGLALAIGAAAAIFLGGAFLCALRLLRIGSIAALPTQKVADGVFAKDFHQKESAELWASIAKNTSDAYKLLLDDNAADAPLACWLNRCLITGYMLSAVFLALAIGLRFFVPPVIVAAN